MVFAERQKGYLSRMDDEELWEIERSAIMSDQISDPLKIREARKMNPKHGRISWAQKKKRLSNKRRDERYFCHAGCGRRVPRRGLLCNGCLILSEA